MINHKRILHQFEISRIEFERFIHSAQPNHIISLGFLTINKSEIIPKAEDRSQIQSIGINISKTS